MTRRKRSCVSSRTASVVAEKVACGELEVLEVDDRLATLRGGVLGREALEQLLEEVAVVRRKLLERGALDRLARHARTTPRAAPSALEPERSTTRSGGDSVVSDSERLRRIAALGLRRGRVCRRRARPPREARELRADDAGRSPSSRTRSRPAERSVS